MCGVLEPVKVTDEQQSLVSDNEYKMRESFAPLGNLKSDRACLGPDSTCPCRLEFAFHACGCSQPDVTHTCCFTAESAFRDLSLESLRAKNGSCEPK